MDAEASTHDLSESVIQSPDDSKLGTELDRSLAEKAATLAWRTSRDRTSSSVHSSLEIRKMAIFAANRSIISTRFLSE